MILKINNKHNNNNNLGYRTAPVPLGGAGLNGDFVLRVVRQIGEQRLREHRRHRVGQFVGVRHVARCVRRLIVDRVEDLLIRRNVKWRLPLHRDRTNRRMDNFDAVRRTQHRIDP